MAAAGVDAVVVAGDDAATGADAASAGADAAAPVGTDGADGASENQSESKSSVTGVDAGEDCMGLLTLDGGGCALLCDAGPKGSGLDALGDAGFDSPDLDEPADSGLDTSGCATSLGNASCTGLADSVGAVEATEASKASESEAGAFASPAALLVLALGVLELLLAGRFLVR